MEWTVKEEAQSTNKIIKAIIRADSRIEGMIADAEMKAEAWEGIIYVSLVLILAALL